MDKPRLSKASVILTIAISIALVGLFAVRNISLRGGGEEHAEEARIEHAYYNFEGFSPIEAMFFVAGTEYVLGAAYELFGIQSAFKPTITFDNENPTRVAFNSLAYDPTDRQNLGLLLGSVGGHGLPYWLCAALELYFLEQSGMGWFGFEKGAKTAFPFGDEWFIPGFFGDGGIPDEALAALYAYADGFVLSNTDLSSIPRSDFQYMPGGGVYAYTETAFYHFFSHQWQWDSISEFIKMSDDTLRLHSNSMNHIGGPLPVQIQIGIPPFPFPRSETYVRAFFLPEADYFIGFFLYPSTYLALGR
jgi:hypothetical protein